MGRKPKYNEEVKVQACEDYQKGNGSFKSIAKSIGADYETVRRWYLRYKEHGHNA
ncbi:MAG: transposase, partial [Firmicutes bacterium]|nr:transposase [Bacillota bacterium]